MPTMEVHWGRSAGYFPLFIGVSIDPGPMSTVATKPKSFCDPKGPFTSIVDTWALKGFPYFGALVYVLYRYSDPLGEGAHFFFVVPITSVCICLSM